MRDVGRYVDALALTERLVERADELAFPPLQADVLIERGFAHTRMSKLDDAADSLSRAYFLAHESRHDKAALAAAMQMIWVVGYELRRKQDGELWVRIAEGWLRRNDASDGEWATFLQNSGVFHVAAGQFERGIDEHQRSAVLWERLHGPNSAKLAATFNNLGVGYADKREFDRAEPNYRKALDIWTQVGGPDHPYVASTMVNLGNTLVGLGEHDEAIELLGRAVTQWQDAVGPDHLDVGVAKLALGDALIAARRYAKARPLHRDALAIFKAAFGDDHVYVAYPLVGVGRAAIGLGEPGKAIPQLERALALRRQADARALELADVEFALARALWAAGQTRQRATTLATGARKRFLDERVASEAAEVDAWLSEVSEVGAN